MRSSRSLTARAMSPWRATLISAKLCKRPFELGKLGGLGRPFLAAALHMHDQRDGERDQRKDGEARERKQNEDGIERDAADCDGREGHEENV